MKIIIRSTSKKGDEVLNNLLHLKENARSEKMSFQERLLLRKIGIEKRSDKPLEICYVLPIFKDIPLNDLTRSHTPALFTKVHDMMRSVGAKEKRDYEVDVI